MVGIDWGNLIIPEIWCYFNVNIPIYSKKLLEKSSVSTGYAGGKVELYTEDVEKGQLVTQSMKVWEQGLAHTSIVRIHKSYFVNLLHVKEIRVTEVILDELKTPLPLGRKYKNRVREQYQKFLLDMMERKCM